MAPTRTAEIVLSVMDTAGIEVTKINGETQMEALTETPNSTHSINSTYCYAVQVS